MKVAGATPSQHKVLDAFFVRHDFAGVDFELNIKRHTSMMAESFVVSAEKKGHVVSATLAVNADRSLRYALNALRRWLRSGAAAPLQLEDQPAFRWRGVIEGFYGNPWTHAQRLEGVEYFGDFGMNMFIIAPKDSQWQRFHWRAPLSAEFLSELAEIVERGSAHGISVSASVSPGLSVCYSSDDDVNAVVHRLQQMHEIGSRDFFLLLDDIPDTLVHESDKARYGNIAEAHADFANRVRLGLMAIDPSALLVLCPMHYAGRGTEPYCLVMGEMLHPQIELMWTGRDICSGYLDISDAVIFDRSTRRPPFYWDNYPVNDGSMQVRLHIGPLTGREAGLEKFSAGYLSNPMELFHASLISVHTIGAYLWNTKNYDAGAAWEVALVDLIPVETDRIAMREFFRMSLGLTGAWAPAINSVIGDCATAWRAGRPQAAADTARAAAKKLAEQYEVIMAPGFCAPKLRQDCAPWLTKYAKGPGWLNALADALDSCTADSERQLHAPLATRDQLARIRTEFKQDPIQLFGDGLEHTFGELIAEITFDA